MNHSIYLGSLLCSAIFLNKKELGTFLCYISMKKRQCNVIFSKKHLILSVQIKKIHNELIRHAAVLMDLPILTADGEITRHKSFKANVPCNGTWNWLQLYGKLKQIVKQQKKLGILGAAMKRNPAHTRWTPYCSRQFKVWHCMTS